MLLMLALAAGIDPVATALAGGDPRPADPIATAGVPLLAPETDRPAAEPAEAPPPPPAKQWVWLPKQGLWGFGRQRPDGLWVIDPGSKRQPAVELRGTQISRPRPRAPPG
jgi:hypothetical protein